MVVLSATHEVADLNDADQFPIGKSQFMCGFFACYIAKSMAQVGQPPLLTTQQIIADATAAYAQYDGSNAANNTDGMSLQQEYDLLHQIGLHYQGLDLDMANIKAWIDLGYVVLVGVVERSVLDLVLGDVNPYPWTPAGNHVILLTGVAADGNVLARDSANCTDLYNPNSLRAGPRKYDAARLELVSATVVVPPWLPRPTSVIAPKGGMPVIGIPSGWTDNGQVLKPDGCQFGFEHGFRDWVLSHAWDAHNWPMENENSVDQIELSNPRLGAGQRQRCRLCTLEHTHEKGVFIGWVGQELLFVENSLKSYVQHSATQTAQIAQLEAQIAQLEAQKPVPPVLQLSPVAREMLKEFLQIIQYELLLPPGP